MTKDTINFTDLIAKNYLLWKKKEKFFPLQLELELTKRCNLNCWHCWRNYFPYSKKELPDRDILKIIELLVAQGLQRIEIPGAGEPMLKKKLIRKIISLFPQLKYTLTTNGTLFSWEDIPWIIKFDTIYISIDGLSAFHNKNRGENTFEKIDNFLIELLAYKNAKRTPQPHIIFKTILFDSTPSSRVKELIEFAVYRKVDGIFFMPFQNYKEKTTTSPKLQPADWEWIFNYNISTNIKDFFISNTSEQKEKHQEHKIKNKKTDKKEAFCYYPWYNILISAEGMVGPCCNQTIFELEKPEDIWKIWEEKFSLFRRKKADCTNKCTEWIREFWLDIDEKVSLLQL